MATIWNVALELEEAKSLADLTGVSSDLEFVAEVCDRLAALLQVPQSDGVIAEALSTAAVVRYARCFNGGARDPLPRDIPSRLGEDRLLLHDRVFAMRQKHYAHSVNAFEDNQVVAWVSDNPAETAISGVSVIHSRIGVLELPLVQSLGALCRELLGLVRARILVEEAKVDALARALPYETLRSRDLPDAFAPEWSEVNKKR